MIIYKKNNQESYSKENYTDKLNEDNEIDEENNYNITKIIGPKPFLIEKITKDKYKEMMLLNKKRNSEDKKELACGFFFKIIYHNNDLEKIIETIKNVKFKICGLIVSENFARIYPKDFLYF